MSGARWTRAGLGRCLALLTLALTTTLATAPAAGADGATAASGDPALVVQLDQESADVGPGETIRFTSTVRNTGDRPLTGLVAHLNIAATDAAVYVDPEDWSPRRTQYVDELAPGGSRELDWSVQAVTSGTLLMYVAVASGAEDQVVASGPLRMQVGGQRVVDAAGVLPFTLAVPLGVLGLLAATRVRRRRHR